MAFLAVILIPAPSAWAGSEKVLYTFTGGADGGNPYAGLVVDKAGNLYGTTFYGGISGCYDGCGTVFELTPTFGGRWTETTIYSFTGGADGGDPMAGLTLDGAGNLYGTTYFAGANACGSYGGGVAFALSPSTSGGWTQAVLHSFTGGSDGCLLQAGLTFDRAGHLYGAAVDGGGSGGNGTLFELIEGRDGWGEKTLLMFGGGDGSNPEGGLIFDGAGNVYGTSYLGGSHNGGTVYEVMRNSRKQKTLYSFKCGVDSHNCKDDGGNPSAAVVLDRAGNLYGTTPYGGSGDCGLGCGTVFKLAHSSGGQWKESIIYNFNAFGEPWGGLIVDSVGNLYGTTEGGGAHNRGAVYKLMPSSGGHWKKMVLYSFTGGSDGAFPYSTLLMDAAGKLYGTTAGGGTAGCMVGEGCGVVFEITP